MKQFFILGRNPQLSRQEILAYLRARKIPVKEILFQENLFVLETQKIPIQELGGSIKSGEITFKGSATDFKDFLEKNELVPADKFSYGIFGNLEPEILKQKFKQMKKKAILKHGRTKIRFREGNRAQLPNTDFYIFLCKFQNKFYFGLTSQEYDYSKIKERDMNKPIRRESLAISPRLAKILVNLSEAKENDLLLDPFCGVGGILQEALLKNINVHGIDKDTDAIKSAEKNLNWLKQNYQIKNSCKLENTDSKQTPNLQFDAIATETPLGEVLRKKPDKKEAEKIIKNFENLIIPILKRLKQVKKPKAKIAMTIPAIQDQKVNLEKIKKETGLKITTRPILESRPDQFVSREILVFE